MLIVDAILYLPSGPQGTVFSPLIIFYHYLALSISQKTIGNCRKCDIFFKFSFNGKNDISVICEKSRKYNIYIVRFFFSKMLFFMQCQEKSRRIVFRSLLEKCIQEKSVYKKSCVLKENWKAKWDLNSGHLFELASLEIIAKWRIHFFWHCLNIKVCKLSNFNIGTVNVFQEIFLAALNGLAN